MAQEAVMRLNTHLTFNGTCREAFEFYEKCFGGKIMFSMTVGESPMASQSSPEWQKKIMHISLRLGNDILTGADAPSGIYEKPQGFGVLFSLDQPADADRIFQELAGGGTLRMPIQETFWALRFGECVDRFGIPWMINCSKPM
jgi:PhnB protein